MKFELEGFDEFQKQLESLERAAKELDGEHDVPLSELLCDQFLAKYSNYESLEEFEREEIFKRYDTFEQIPESELDELVASKTNFDSWSEMLEKAGEYYITKKLGF